MRGREHPRTLPGELTIITSTVPAAAGIRLERPPWPLLSLPPFATGPHEHFAASNLEPEEIWRSFRAAQRSSPSVVARCRARIYDAYRTTTPEYLDRSDVSAPRREGIIRALDRTHRVLRTYPRLCRLLLPLVEGLIRPRILETASGHGQLAIALERALATRGISAMVTGSDLAPELVALSQRNAAAAGSRARFRRLDATALEIPDDSQDLVLNALSMHHLPFGMVVKALAEMRRVAPRAVVFDLLRAPVFLAPATIVMFALSQSLDCTHDGIISLRKAWGADEWRLAAELAGWSSMSIGVMLPSFVFVRLDR